MLEFDRSDSMNRTHFLRGISALCTMTTLSLSLGCGTILYPERRGQRTTARVDPGVAVMDACWLLLFIIPGVIAFAVDFSNGAIYLPGGRASGEPLKVVHTDAAHPDRAAIERTIEQQTGLPIRLDDPAMVRRELPSRQDIEPSLAAARQDRLNAL